VADAIKFDRTPYNVTYYKDGEKKVIRRVPPPKLHEGLPTDIVELKSKRSDDFPEGENYKIKHINPRHPNTLQIEDEDGKTTFVSSFEVELKEKIAEREGEVAPGKTYDVPRLNRYLLWP
jgi:hypothetical protein